MLPTSTQALTRLGAVVLVLFATLIVQALTGQRFKAVQRLKVERDRLFQMYEHSPDPILCLRPDLRIAYANPAADTFFSEKRGIASLVGVHCKDRLWGEAECEDCLGTEVLKTGETGQRTVHDSAGGYQESYMAYLRVEALATIKTNSTTTTRTPKSFTMSPAKILEL